MKAPPGLLDGDDADRRELEHRLDLEAIAMEGDVRAVDVMRATRGSREEDRGGLVFSATRRAASVERWARGRGVATPGPVAMTHAILSRLAIEPAARDEQLIALFAAVPPDERPTRGA